MAGRMKAQNHLGAWRAFHAEALGADGHAPIGADLHGRADAPNIGPPRAARGGAQDRSLFFLGQIPGLLRGHSSSVRQTGTKNSEIRRVPIIADLEALLRRMQGNPPASGQILQVNRCNEALARVCKDLGIRDEVLGRALTKREVNRFVQKDHLTIQT